MHGRTWCGPTAGRNTGESLQTRNGARTSHAITQGCGPQVGDVVVINNTKGSRGLGLTDVSCRRADCLAESGQRSISASASSMEVKYEKAPGWTHSLEQELSHAAGCLGFAANADQSVRFLGHLVRVDLLAELVEFLHGNGLPYSAAGSNRVENIGKLLRLGEKRRMIRVDQERLAARRRLLHGALKL
jgi:hypothetical protein